jgi:tripartite-type tricarboxylate transporter receptor subunit TctC
MVGHNGETGKWIGRLQPSRILSRARIEPCKQAGIREGNAMSLGRQKFVQLGVTAIVAIAVFMLSGQGAWSQATKIVKIVVPVSPGGVLDAVARLLGEQIRHAQGHAVLVENRPGAGGMIAAEAVSRATPDGNTLMIASPDLLVTSHLRKLDYDLRFEPVCYLVSVPNVIVVNSASPYWALGDLLDAARAKPGGLTLASVGPATSLQIAFEKLKRAANVEMTFVAYPGAAPAINALLGNHVTSALAAYFTVAGQLKSAKLRALAVVTKTRIEPLPEVPTVAESGYKDYQADFWLGVIAPAKTPKETISQLAAWFTAAAQAPEVKPKLLAQGLYPAVTCRADFTSFLRIQYDDVGRIIRELNIKTE